MDEDAKHRMSQIAIIGAGAWGTGLAIVLGRKGTHRVRLWAHETDVCESITQKRYQRKDFFPAATSRNPSRPATISPPFLRTRKSSSVSCPRSIAAASSNACAR